MNKRFALGLVLASLAYMAAGAAEAQTAASAPAVYKQPPCLPKQWGSTGSAYKSGKTLDVNWLAWTCQVKGAPVLYMLFRRDGYVVKHPDPASSATLNETVRAYLAANVDPTDVSFREAAAAARAAFGM